MTGLSLSTHPFRAREGARLRTHTRTSALRRLKESSIGALLFLCGLVSVLITLAIVISLFSETVAFFKRPEVEFFTFLTGTTWRPTVTPIKPVNFGILPLLNGTLMIAVLSGIIAIPIGLASATYLSEYAPDKARRVLKPMLELLAGIPTVVYGYFAITVITPLLRGMASWLNSITGSNVEVGFFNALSASIVVAIMVIPMVASISEDAMRAVPIL